MSFSKNKPEVFTMQDLAVVLQCSVTSLYAKLPKLYDAGFPRPLPILGLKFSKQMVLDWINQHSHTPAIADEMPKFISAHQKYLENALSPD